LALLNSWQRLLPSKTSDIFLCSLNLIVATFGEENVETEQTRRIVLKEIASINKPRIDRSGKVVKEWPCDE
jgi:hypothetical protein